MTVKKANPSRKPLCSQDAISVVVKARFLHRLYTPISLQHEKGCRALPRQLRQKKKKTLNTVIAQGTGSFFYHVQRNNSSVKNKRGRNHTKCKQACNKLLADKEILHAHNRKKTPRTIRLLAFFCNAKMQRGSACLGTTEQGQPAPSSFFRLPPSTTKL